MVLRGHTQYAIIRTMMPHFAYFSDAEVPTEDTMEVNQLDLFDPVEFLKSLPDDFHEKVQSKKWQERKEALENLDKLSDHPKLMEGDYGEIVSELKKVIVCNWQLILYTHRYLRR